MVEAARTGSVTPIAIRAATTAVDGTEVRRLTPQDLRPAQGTPSASSASLPRLLDLVAELAHSGPPVDYARIAQVRRAIADGSYRIDANALAKAIIGFAAKD